MSFKEWLRHEGYKQPQELYNDLVCEEGMSSEEAREELDKLKDEYSDYCDDNDIELDYDDV